MKTTNNRALVTAVVLSVFALIGLTKVTANIVPTIIVGGSYVVVAILFALAAMDYRVGTKNYPAR